MIRAYRRAELVTGVVIGGATLVGAWPLLVALTEPTPAVGLVGRVAGMLAGYLVLVALLLMSRWPVLEHGIGADTLARWHAPLGRAVVALVVIHAVAAVAAWSHISGLSPAAALIDTLGWTGMLAATVGTVLLLVVAVTSARAARRRLSHGQWHAIHLTTYVAVALSFAHQLAGPDLAGRTALQVLWSLLYAATFGLVLTYRIIAPLHGAFRHRLRVVGVVPEAPGVTSIVLQGRHLDELAARPGQFLRWRFLAPGLWLTAHPFSLSAPTVGDRLRITVKALGDGSSALQTVPLGTRVVAEGPYGTLTADRRRRRGVLLVAGGIGITPLRALLETLDVTGPGDLVLLYRAPTPEDVVFRGELDELAAQRRARVVYLLGDNRALLSPRTFERLVPHLTHRDVYLCGPPGMTAVVHRSLTDAGVPGVQIHEERFAL